MSWLLVHLVSVAVLTGVGWVVQLVVYPGFARVGQAEWATHHAAHLRAITRVVGLPWAVQGISTVALLIEPPPGARPAALALAALAAVTVGVTVAAAVSAHGRLAAADRPRGRELTVLLRANLVRTVAWTAATGLAAGQLG